MKASLLKALETCVDAAEVYYGYNEVMAGPKEIYRNQQLIVKARQGLKSLRSTADPQRRRILRKHREEK